MSYFTVTQAERIPEGSIRVFRVRGKRIAISRVEGKFYAIDDICTHDNGPLGEGELLGEEVACPRHGARFNVRTGEAVSMPAVMTVKVYSVRVQGEEIQLDV